MDLAEDEEEGQEYQEGEGEEGETTTDTGPQGTPLRLAETVKKQKTTNITITNKHQQDLTTFYPTTIQQAYLLSPAVCFIHRTPTSRDESSQKRSWKWYGDAMNDSQSSSGDSLFRRRPSPCYNSFQPTIDHPHKSSQEHLGYWGPGLSFKSQTQGTDRIQEISIDPDGGISQQWTINRKELWRFFGRIFSSFHPLCIKSLHQGLIRGPTVKMDEANVGFNEFYFKR